MSPRVVQAPAPTGPHPRRRVSAAERRRIILDAARTTFAASGDPAGTTVKSVAAAAGVSEAMVYRHFPSKEALFSEAVVEPLRDAIDSYRRTVAQLGVPAAHAQRDEIARIFWSSLIGSMEPILPLLGLVLFGEPRRAKQFWQTTFGSVIEILEERWTRLYQGLEPTHPSHEVAMATIGTAFMVALEARLNPEFDLPVSIEQIDAVTAPGFFPPLPRLSGRDGKPGMDPAVSLGSDGSSRAAARLTSRPTPATPPRNRRGDLRRRLPPEQRRHLILVAARTVFARTGDLSATPVRAIAARAGVSEAIIYHYFRSKEELFSEAVVESLRESTAQMSGAALAAEDGGRAEDKVLGFWRDLIASLAEMLPMLGFVLFGNPSESGEFHRSTLTPAITDMASRWQEDCDGRGIEHPSDLVALSSVGIALVFALDARYHRDGDPDGDLRALTRVTMPGFWPAL